MTTQINASDFLYRKILCLVVNSKQAEKNLILQEIFGFFRKLVLKCTTNSKKKQKSIAFTVPLVFQKQKVQKIPVSGDLYRLHLCYSAVKVTSRVKGLELGDRE